MSSKPSKRERVRELLRHPGQIFRSRSPSASGASRVNTQPPTLTPTDRAASTSLDNQLNSGSILGAPPPVLLVTQPAATSSSFPEPVPRSPDQRPQTPTSHQSARIETTPTIEATHPASSLIERNSPRPSITGRHALGEENAPSRSLQAKDLVSATLKFSLDGLKTCVNQFPALKSVVDLLVDCIEDIPTSVQSRQDYEELASNIVSTAKSFEEHLDQVNPTQMTWAVAGVLDELEKLLKHILQKQARTRAREYVDTGRDVEDLARCYRRVEALLRQLQNNAILSIWRIANESLSTANENIVNTRLGGLSPVKQARYDSSAASQVRRGGCTPNTRQLVLQELKDWANDPDGAKVYWMNGMAGTGKTTIAYSLCSQLEAAHQLAASFFCSRSLPDCRDVSRIAPTIAYQLARFCRPFQDVLCQALGSDPDIGTRGVTTQFEKLLGDPLREVKGTLPAGLLIVVIDALDECSDRLDALTVLDALLRFAEDLPIKFFVTCRPDSILLNKMSSNGDASRSLYHLHDIEQSLVQADIETYLSAELEPTQPTTTLIKRLAEQSGRLFIYAATVVRYIGVKNPSIDSQKRLEIVLGMTPNSTSKAYGPLDALYTAILSAALEDSELEPWESENIKLALHTVICAREPLTVEGLARLLKLEGIDQARLAIEPLRSVLHVDERSGLVSTLHASFPDYMHNPTRSKGYSCNENEHHALLSRQCFDTMKGLLRFNICNLESSFMLDSDIPDLPIRVGDAIPSHLFYACRYWSDHSILAGDASELIVLLEDFFYRQMLFWMEVINLMRSTRAGVLMLYEIYGWMKNASISDDICVICRDAQKFLSVVGANPVCNSTPHIDISVLALWDKRDPMWIHYGKHMRGLVKSVGSAIDNRESAALAVWRASSQVLSVAVSPDGGRVASACRDYTIHIWDAHSGDVLVGPLKGHTDEVNWVAFSPDGSRIASGSDDRTIRIWDVQTGNGVASPFRGHTDWIRSVAYSPNGSCIISGSDDRTIRVWDVQTGQTLAGPFRGHNGTVCSVAYSPDGHHIASGSGDRTIRVWDVQTGHVVAGPLRGHTGPVVSIAYSPAGSRAASGSDDCSIAIWDTLAGYSLVARLEGHTDTVCRVAFSPDGDRIVSGSQDCTIRIWDAQTGHTVAGPLRAHAHWVYSVAFMPDGNRIISGSADHTIRVWDAQTRRTASSLLDGHLREVFSVGFSHDSNRVVSGSQDRTICIWDVRTGSRLAGPFKGHTDDVNSVAFSPDDSHITSGSDDHTIRIWDSHSGRAVGSPFKGHTRAIISVAYSPDGRHIVSGSDDRTIRVWDAKTGLTVAGPFKGHTKPIRSVAYSSDGSRIASGSNDRSIRVWDARTGGMLVGPFTGHTGPLYSIVYSPDDHCIASSSHDHTIRVWDANTGTTLSGPLRGHTSIVVSIAFLPDGTHLVSGSADSTIRVWDIRTGQVLAGPFRAHTDWVKSVAVSPDGRLIASGADDGVVRIWDWLMLNSSQDPKCWTVNEDGWVVSHDSSLLLWVPPDLRTGLKWPQNVAVIHSRGTLELDFAEALMGKQWIECYKSL